VPMGVHMGVPRLPSSQLQVGREGAWQQQVPMGGPMGTPVARAAPRGLAGLVDRNHPAPYELLDTSQFPRNFVLLNVYDIGEANIFQRINAVSTVGDNVLIGGIYHAGVQIYGLEWSFGFTEDEDTGVFSVLPRMATQHTYRVTCPLGISEFTETEVMGLIQVMQDQWRGSEYHLLHRNCLDFSNALCCELGVGRIPGWVDRFGRTASSIDNFTTKVGTGVNQTRQLVGTGVNQTKQLAHTVGADVGDKLRGVGDQARQVVGDMRREAPKLAEAAQTGAQTIGNNVKHWSKGLISVARALGEEHGQARRGTHLKHSLRNRGGLQEFFAHGPLRSGGGGDDSALDAFSPPSLRNCYNASRDDAFLLEGLLEHESDQALEADAALEEALEAKTAFEEDATRAAPSETIVTDSHAEAILPAAEIVSPEVATTPASNEDSLASEGSHAALREGEDTSVGVESVPEDSTAVPHAVATSPAAEIVSPEVATTPASIGDSLASEGLHAALREAEDASVGVESVPEGSTVVPTTRMVEGHDAALDVSIAASPKVEEASLQVESVPEGSTAVSTSALVTGNGAASEIFTAASPKAESATTTSESAPPSSTTFPTNPVLVGHGVASEVSTAASSPKAESAANTIKSAPSGDGGALEMSPVASTEDSPTAAVTDQSTA